jgi:hypothetical protein
MNPVCRQCSKTCADIGDGKPHCAVCLMTMPADVAQRDPGIAAMNAMERLDRYASDLNDAPLAKTVDDVSAWLMGAERNRQAEDLVIGALFDLHRHPEDAEWGDTEISDSLALLMLITGVDE